MAQYLITLSGIDGSGKSTSIDLIEEHLGCCEKLHILNFRFINRILKKMKIEVDSLPPIPKKGMKSKQALYTKNIKAYLNSILMLIDIIIFRMHWLLCRKCFVICDRYFFDLIISQQYRTGNVPFERLILKLIKNPDLAIYIYVDPIIAAKRESFDTHPAVYFSAKQKLYEHRYRELNMWKIESTNKTKKQTCVEILAKIKSCGINV